MRSINYRGHNALTAMPWGLNSSDGKERKAKHEKKDMMHAREKRNGKGVCRGKYNKSQDRAHTGVAEHTHAHAPLGHGVGYVRCKP